MELELNFQSPFQMEVWEKGENRLKINYQTCHVMFHFFIEFIRILVTNTSASIVTDINKDYI